MTKNYGEEMDILSEAIASIWLISVEKKLFGWRRGSKRKRLTLTNMESN